MKRILFLLLAFVAMNAVQAQNKFIYEAEDLMNQGKLEEARNVIDQALNGPKTTNLAKANLVAGEIYTRLLNLEIVKASKKEAFDTTAFVSYLDKATNYLETGYQEDIKPNKKGEVKPKYALDFKKNLKNIWVYYVYAGQFLNGNKDFDGAYKAFSRFVEIPKSAIFSKEECDTMLKNEQKTIADVAYYATILAYQSKQWDNVLKQVDVALSDTANLNDLYLMKLTAQLSKGDTAQWIETSKEAIKRVPGSSSYMQNLLSYYNMKNDTATALAMGNEFVSSHPEKAITWFARGSIYLNMLKDYEKARQDFMKAVEIDPDFHQAEANIAIAYINEGAQFGETLPNNIQNPKYKAGVEKLKEYYKKAKPHAEKARALAPDFPKEWAVALSQIYYNLGDNAKSEEMTRILNQMTSGK